MQAKRPNSDVEDGVKVRFELDRDGEGWPPVDSELLWGLLLGPTVVKIDSIPWFVSNVALHDLFAVELNEDGEYMALDKLRWSGNCTIRVIPMTDEPNAAERIVGRFTTLGVDTELIESFDMIALNVPRDGEIAGVKRLLEAGEASGAWSFDEGCVGDTWIQA